MDQDKNQIKAILEKDLKEVLKKIGLDENFDNKRITCKFCKDIITIDNIHSILPESGAYHFICSKPECSMLLTQYLENKKH